MNNKGITGILAMLILVVIVGAGIGYFVFTRPSQVSQEPPLVVYEVDPPQVPAPIPSPAQPNPPAFAGKIKATLKTCFTNGECQTVQSKETSFIPLPQSPVVIDKNKGTISYWEVQLTTNQNYGGSLDFDRILTVHVVKGSQNRTLPLINTLTAIQVQPDADTQILTRKVDASLLFHLMQEMGTPGIFNVLFEYRITIPQYGVRVADILTHENLEAGSINIEGGSINPITDAGYFKTDLPRISKIVVFSDRTVQVYALEPTTSGLGNLVILKDGAQLFAGQCFGDKCFIAGSKEHPDFAASSGVLICANWFFNEKGLEDGHGMRRCGGASELIIFDKGIYQVSSNWGQLISFTIP